MRVRLLVDVSGTRDGVPWPSRGNEMDLPDDEARQLVAATMAVPVDEFRRAETAVAPTDAVEVRATELPLTTDTGLVPGRQRRGSR